MHSIERQKLKQCIGNMPYQVIMNFIGEAGRGGGRILMGAADVWPPSWNCPWIMQTLLTNRHHWWSGREVVALWQTSRAADEIPCWTGRAIAWSAGTEWRRAASCARTPSGRQLRRRHCGSRRGCSVPANDHVIASRRPGTRSLPGNDALCRSLRCPGRHQQIAERIYTVFRKKHPLVFSCITLRKSNQFEWKFQIEQIMKCWF